MINVRPLASPDADVWRRLWRGYLDFYGSALDDAVTEATFERLLNDDRMFGFVAEKDGVICGFVHCVLHPATWSVRESCYLEDLFVDPAVRGAGAGRALIEAVYAAAAMRGADRVYWLTHETNQRARILYDKVASFDGFVQYRRKL